MSTHASLRLLAVAARDVDDVVAGKAGNGREPDRGIDDAVGVSVAVELTRLPAGGWAATAERVRSFTTQRPFTLLISVSAELEDPSPDPKQALLALAGLVTGERGGRIVVLNASSVAAAGASMASGGSLELAIRRLNLVAVEVSHETGISVLDADRVVATASAGPKVGAALDYSPDVLRSLQAALVRILDDLGVGAGAVLEARVPFVRPAKRLRIERWLSREGDRIEPGDRLCEIGLVGARRMTRPTNAVVLASISGRRTLRSLLSRERAGARARTGTLSLVARDAGVLRRIMAARGAAIHPGDAIAVFTPEPDSAIEGVRPDAFRAMLQTDDPVLSRML
ncbi:MAG TPA: hypothetical protein VG709_03550 [Actinomycetota bacterium]|nr:hypothetical protein [Actinomycetota bacterium]